MSQAMNHAGQDLCTKKEPNYFEQIEARIRQAAGRTEDVEYAVRGIVNALNGSEPSPVAEKSQESTPSTIFERVGLALLQLEHRLTELEHEANRLSRLFE